MLKKKKKRKKEETSKFEKEKVLKFFSEMWALERLELTFPNL